MFEVSVISSLDKFRIFILSRNSRGIQSSPDKYQLVPGKRLATYVE